MSLCWYCYWGWASPVADIYNGAVKRLHGNEDPLLYGAGHLVWADENWDYVDWCIENFDDYKERYSQEELTVVMWSLKELQKIPLEQREIEPKDYDGCNPEAFPPPVGIEVVRIR